jgi:hypothetical protein
VSKLSSFEELFPLDTDLHRSPSTAPNPESQAMRPSEGAEALVKRHDSLVHFCYTCRRCSSGEWNGQRQGENGERTHASGHRNHPNLREKHRDDGTDACGQQHLHPTSPSGSSAPCAALGATIPNDAVVSVSSGRKLHRDMDRVSVRRTSVEVQQAAVMTPPTRSHLLPTPRCASLPLSVAPTTMPAPVQANSTAKRDALVWKVSMKVSGDPVI